MTTYGLKPDQVRAKAESAQNRTDWIVRRGWIVQINKPGHEWYGRRVVVAVIVGSSKVECELLEQQSLADSHRVSCLFSLDELTLLSFDEQWQTASTMGLRLEALPYVSGSHPESELPMHLRRGLSHSRDMATTVTADNFDDFFCLDYAFRLAEGLSNLSEDSAVVRRLRDWCSERGYAVDLEVCREVLQSQIERHINLGDE